MLASLVPEKEEIEAKTLRNQEAFMLLYSTLYKKLCMMKQKKCGRVAWFLWH